MQKPSHKLYILVDKTLKPSQQAVQACHAAIEFAKAYPDWKHESLVMLGIDGERELEDWYTFLAHKKYSDDVKVYHFREPYWDDRLTAIACHNVDEYVKKLPLL